MFVAVTCVEDCDQVAFQPWVRVWPAPKSNSSFHELSGSPRLVNETSAWKPVCHWLVTLYVTEQPLLAADACITAATAPADTRLVAAAATRTVRYLLMGRSPSEAGIGTDLWG